MRAFFFIVAVPLLTAAAAVSVQPQTHPSPTLRSVASATDDEDRCEVLLAWLQSESKAEGRVGERITRMRIFRDEPMKQVWGVTYDGVEPAWWAAQYDRVAAPCLAIDRASRDARTRERARAFVEYRSVLLQAMRGRPGMFAPEAVTKYVRQTRQEVAWVAETLAAVNAAAPSAEGFAQLLAFQSATGRTITGANDEDRRVVQAQIERRKAQIAPAIADEWLQQASRTAKDLASVRALAREHSTAMARVVAALEPAARAAWIDRYERLVGPIVEPAVGREIAALDAIPQSLQGIRDLAVWHTRYSLAFGDLHGLTAVEEGTRKYVERRKAVVSAAYPSWEAQVTALSDPHSIATKERELAELFPDDAARSTSEYTRYETVLRARADALRHADARLGGTPRPVDSAPLTPTSLRVGGLSIIFGEDARRIYRGDFSSVTTNPETRTFTSLLHAYMMAFGRKCAAYLPGRKVELQTGSCEYNENLGPAGWTTCRGVPSGVFADPELAAAMDALDQKIAGAALDDLRAMLRNPKGALASLSDAAEAARDMRTLVANNDCASASLERFADNLLRYARKEAAIPLR
jgi:hypothetical protein